MPKLGSVQDSILRRFMLRESEVQLEATQFQMLAALATPTFNTQSNQTKWTTQIRTFWRKYISGVLGFHEEYDPETDPNFVDPSETALKQYYDKVISKLKPTISKDPSKKGLLVKGLEALLK